MSEWVADAEQRLAELPREAGVYVEWAGTFQSLARAEASLAWMVPITLLGIALLLRLNTGSWAETAIVMMAVPFRWWAPSGSWRRSTTT